MLSTLFSPLEAVFTIRRDFYRVYHSNTQLRIQLATLQLQNDHLRQYKAQNNRLRELLNLKQTRSESLILGEVLSRGTGYYQNSWRINLGLKDSLSTNMPVLTNNGLVGKIAKVYPTSSLLQILTDPNSRVSVLNQRSREVGVLGSQGLNYLVALFPPQSNIKTGDVLVTSGLGGVFPKGLHIGVIKKKLKGESDVLTSWYIQPFENFNRVEEVLVMKRIPTWNIQDSLGDEVDVSDSL